MTDMKRWSDAKLDKELAFAKAADDGSADCHAWLVACQREAQRRGWAGYVSTKQYGDDIVFA